MPRDWTGDQIRIRRRDLGLSQAELAKRADLSQGYVSLLERGEAVSPDALEALATALGLTRERRPPKPDAPSLLHSGPRIPSPTSPGATLSVDIWMRPEDGGDLIMVCPVAPRATLVAALDVAGHGRAKRAVATWIAGWIRGRLAGTPGVPRLTDLWVGLGYELNAIDEGAAFFLASLERWSDSHHIRYEGLTDGYPPPLLVAGHKPRVLESCGSPVTTTGGRSEPRTVVHGDLRPPWRLAIASDGLLYRAGGGDESAGLRWLRRWQTGPDKSIALADRLDGSAPVIDDESMAVISWNDWDLNAAFDPKDRRSHDTLQRSLQQLSSALTTERREALAQVVAEVLSNASRYAPAAPARMRARRLDDGTLQVQVADSGPGPAAIRAGEGLSLIKELVDHLELIASTDGGTTVAFEMTPGGGHT